MIDNLRKGEHKTFEMLFKEWYVPMCRYAVSILQDDDEAKDVVQKFFCKLWDKHSEIDIRTSLQSYLYRSVHNECLNVIKKRKVKADYIEYASSSEVHQDKADKRVIIKELEENVKKAIEKLPPRCKEIFLLSRMNNMTYSEIADSLGIAVGTVEIQMVKALRSLRNELKDYLCLLLLLGFFSVFLP